MRIRRHAKLAGLAFSNAAGSSDLSPHLGLQPRICHLNQSPWDAISFPPDSASSPYQFDGEDSFTANGSFGDSLGAVESVASMKISLDGDERNAIEGAPKRALTVAEDEEDEEEGKDQVGFGRVVAASCCKTDGKGWQCKKEATRGHSLCDHHLAQLRAYSSGPHPAAGRKSDKPAALRRRQRPKKAPSASTSASNPYEFYYYSGFGPRWAKKRGSTMERGVPHEDKPDEAEDGAAESSPSSSQIENEEFDYMEDDDDDDDSVDGEFERKRIRKPIKARSLKSLM